MAIKRLSVWLLLGFTVQPLVSPAAAVPAAVEAGIYTIVEGDARILRGTAWFKVIPGTHALEADLIELGERGTIQIELPRGSALNIIGPATAYAARPAAPAAAKGAAGADEWTVAGGWVKATLAAGAAPLRLHVPQASIELTEGTIVATGEADTLRLFIESGRARVAFNAGKGKAAPPKDAHAGEFWVRTGDAPPRIEPRVPPAFVTTMPRALLDPLPHLAARYAGPQPPLKRGAEATYAEAEPWLTGPYRKAFMKRFAPRLSDAAFRAGVETHLSAYPEWDRVLHPEKYSTDKASAAR